MVEGRVEGRDSFLIVCMIVRLLDASRIFYSGSVSEEMIFNLLRFLLLTKMAPSFASVIFVVFAA